MQLTPIEQFIQSPELKFAVITRESWQTDAVAQSIAPSPRVFELNQVEYALLSISKYGAQRFVDYLNQLGVGYDFDMVQHTGNVKLLLHSQVLALLAALETDEAPD